MQDLELLKGYAELTKAVVRNSLVEIDINVPKKLEKDSDKSYFTRIKSYFNRSINLMDTHIEFASNKENKIIHHFCDAFDLDEKRVREAIIKHNKKQKAKFVLRFSSIKNNFKFSYLY